MASPSITAVVPRYAMTNPTAIQQRVAPGKIFTGALPQAGAVRADSPLDKGASIYKYTQLAEDGGGLFFWNTYEPLICTQIYVDLGAVGNITIKLVGLDPSKINDDLPAVLSGEAVTVEAATGVSFIALDEARFKTVLLPYQAIQIITTASGQAQIARVGAGLERMYVR
jgi:hypothetical protein